MLRRGMMAQSAGGGPPWANVVALLHMDGSNGSTTFTDEKGAAYTRTNTPTISTAQSKFGGASGLFANNSAVTSPSSATYAITGSFTVEMWVRPTAVTALAGLWTLYAGGGVYAHINNTGKVVFSNGAVTCTSTGSLAAGVWVHLAFVRSGSTYTTYINGVADGTASSADNFASNRALKIGADPAVTGGSGGMAGYFDDVRFTNGVAVYTANFTPPNAPFPNS